MNVLCIKGLPQDGLHQGTVYTKIDSYTCTCNKRTWFLLAEVESHRVPPKAVNHRHAICNSLLPKIVSRMYGSNRFVPWSDINISQEEVDALYQPSPPEVVYG